MSKHLGSKWWEGDGKVARQASILGEGTVAWELAETFSIGWFGITEEECKEKEGTDRSGFKSMCTNSDLKQSMNLSSLNHKIEQIISVLSVQSLLQSHNHGRHCWLIRDILSSNCHQLELVLEMKYF